MERIPVIRTKNLSIGYVLKGGHLKLVHDALDLNLYPGEVTCLLGLNGAGKSTLLRTLCGFQPSLGGEIELKGKPLSSYSQGDFRPGIQCTDRYPCCKYTGGYNRDYRRGDYSSGEQVHYQDYKRDDS